MKGSGGHRFVLCIRNDEYPASLERWKIYEVLPDAEAEKHNQIRVVDESGEDCLYPEDYFVTISLPKAAEEAIVNGR